jgi:hypothetical protein
MIPAFASTELIWEGDASLGTGIFDGLEPHEGTITVIDAPAFGKCFKFYKPSNCSRTESRGAKGYQAREGDDIYIGWRFKIEMPQNSTNNSIFQWKSYPAAKQNFPVILKHLNGNFTLMYQNPDYKSEYPWKKNTAVDTWLTVVLHLKISRDEKIGFIEFWYNGEQQTLSNGRTRYPARTLDDGENDPKWGVYGATGTTMTLYVHALRIASDYASAAPERTVMAGSVLHPRNAILSMPHNGGSSPAFTPTGRLVWDYRIGNMHGVAMNGAGLAGGIYFTRRDHTNPGVLICK